MLTYTGQLFQVVPDSLTQMKGQQELAYLTKHWLQIEPKNTKIQDSVQQIFIPFHYMS